MKKRNKKRRYINIIVILATAVVISSLVYAYIRRRHHLRNAKSAKYKECTQVYTDKKNEYRFKCTDYNGVNYDVRSPDAGQPDAEYVRWCGLYG